MARQTTSDDLQSIVRARLAAQQMVRPAFTDPVALVAWLGAVQAQDFAAARWALGLRLGGRPVSEEQIARAVADGRLIRTHVFRWTWQLVVPADLRWMLSLVGSRLIDRASRRHRELDLDAAVLRRGTAVLRRSLRGGAHLTRDELGAALRGAGIATAGGRLSHLLGYGELEGVLCSGSARGKQMTWALLDERIPPDGERRPADRDAALADLARRYFRSRGPATMADFVWWSGLAPADVRTAVAAAGSALQAMALGATTYYESAERPPGRSVREHEEARSHLLPGFDEYLVGYRDRAAMLDPADARQVNDRGGMLSPCVLRDGRVIGTWRRTLERGATAALEVRLFAPPHKQDDTLIRAAADRYGAFLGRRVAVTITGGRRP